MKKIAIFASGTGSNAMKIIEHLGNQKIAVEYLVLSNKKDALVLEKAQKLAIQTLFFNRTDFYETNKILNILISYQPDLLVLAGFLWLVPANLVKHFPNKIINIHPALLPKYGGKGMFGMNVHQTVFEAKERESGMTIHYVNEKYDEGNVIFQAKCSLEAYDTAEDIAHKVLKLEHEYFPKIVEKLLQT